jgi:uncharacterized LabA/DUF88 family protein
VKTSLYVDGFNFYYGCFRYQRKRCVPADKWTDWRTFGEHIAGEDSWVHRIHYFTAYLHRSDKDPEQSIRQELYLRAIDSTPGVEIHYGKHIPVSRKGRPTDPKPADLGLPPDGMIKIRTVEEKGSDVNLAVQLLDDAWSGEVERAIVVSNDTDLISAIRSARRHIRVDVASPQAFLAKEMKKAAQYAWCIDPGILRHCRMSIPKIALDGTELYPPDSWLLEAWPETED